MSISLRRPFPLIDARDFRQQRAEGLAVTPEEDILIADEPKEFANSLTRLLEDGPIRERLSSNGRRSVSTAVGIAPGKCWKACSAR